MMSRTNPYNVVRDWTGTVLFNPLVYPPQELILVTSEWPSNYI